MGKQHMLRAMLITDNQCVQTGGAELVREWQQTQIGFLWLDLFPQDIPEDTPWLREFNIHPLAIQDAQRPRHPPKFEIFNDIMFVLLRGLSSESDSIDVETIQIALFMGKNFLITRHDKLSPSINHYWQHCAGSGDMLPPDPHLISWHISRYAASRYLDLMNNFEPRLWEMEERMFRRPRDTLLNQLTANRTSLRHLTRIFNYHVRVFQGLRHYYEGKNGEHKNNSTDLHHLLTDLYEHYDRLNGLAHMFYDVTGDLIDGYLSTSSHRLNNTMRILTVITAIFVPLNFITGLYGMNFDFMPELHQRYGFYNTVGMMFSIAVLLLIYFRYKRWL